MKLKEVAILEKVERQLQRRIAKKIWLEKDCQKDLYEDIQGYLLQTVWKARRE